MQNVLIIAFLGWAAFYGLVVLADPPQSNNKLISTRICLQRNANPQTYYGAGAFQVNIHSVTLTSIKGIAIKDRPYKISLHK